MDPTQEIFQMLDAVANRAAELKVPSVTLIGLLHHAANVQSASLHAQIMAQRQPTLAEQIMNNRRGPGVVQ